MSAFRSRCIVSPIDNTDLWMIECSLAYDSDLLGKTIIIPAGFVYDGNSVPWIWPTQRMRWPASGALHDYGYRYALWPRKTVDQLYREALAVEGAGCLTRLVRYAGVRLFGGWSYGQIPSDE